jgi:Flp pilus assembly pilin Flp
MHTVLIYRLNGSPERGRSIASNQDGQTMTEYAFVLAGVAVLAAAAYLTFGQSIVAMLGPVVSAFTS